MTGYKVTVFQVNPDYTLATVSNVCWERRLGTDAELAILLNRIAIATSSGEAIEYPRVEITIEGARAVVTSIDGYLYYSDAQGVRQNIKVVAESVIRLIHGETVEGQVAESIAPTTGHAAVKPAPVSSPKRFSWCGPLCLFVACGTLLFSVFRIWTEVSTQAESGRTCRL